MITGLLMAMAMAVKELALLVSHIKNNFFRIPHPENKCLLRLAQEMRRPAAF